MELQPQEIEVWYVLPAIRRELCRGLVARGLSQKEAAKLLGVTEAAVSHYINSKRAAKVKFGRAFDRHVKRIGGKIAAGEMTAYAGIQRLAVAFRHSGGICGLHRAMERVPAGCERQLAAVCRD